MTRGRSWHLPLLDTYHITNAAAGLDLVFLQYMTEREQQHVKQSLESVDRDAVQRLDVGATIQPRPLRLHAWIRDHPATSGAVIVEAAKAALEDRAYRGDSIRVLLFADSGWDAGNVIAAHWEEQEDGELRLIAARVSAGIATVLLTACDSVEGMTLFRALRSDVFERLQVDFYRDVVDHDDAPAPEHKWPEHLPKDLKLDQIAPVIISLRTLGLETIKKLKEELSAGFAQDVCVYNWEGPEPDDRLILRDIYKTMRRTTGVADDQEYLYAWFVDYMLQGPNGEPRLVAVTGVSYRGRGVELSPIKFGKFASALDRPRQGKHVPEEFMDVYEREYVGHLNEADDRELGDCPVFFLHPFTKQEEREIRAKFYTPGSIADDEKYGKAHIFYGFIFDDDKAHTIEDLRDRFELSDPWSPFFDAARAGPYRMSSYPPHFAVVDEKCLEPENPKVWFATTVDFNGPFDAGWCVGRVDAAEAACAFMNFDIANAGPIDVFDDDQIDYLYLSDLTAYRAEFPDEFSDSDNDSDDIPGDDAEDE